MSIRTAENSSFNLANYLATNGLDVKLISQVEELSAHKVKPAEWADWDNQFPIKLEGEDDLEADDEVSFDKLVGLVRFFTAYKKTHNELPVSPLFAKEKNVDARGFARSVNRHFNEAIQAIRRQGKRSFHDVQRRIEYRIESEEADGLILNSYDLSKGLELKLRFKKKLRGYELQTLQIVWLAEPEKLSDQAENYTYGRVIGILSGYTEPLPERAESVAIKKAPERAVSSSRYTRQELLKELSPVQMSELETKITKLIWQVFSKNYGLEQMDKKQKVVHQLLRMALAVQAPELAHLFIDPDSDLNTDLGDVKLLTKKAWLDVVIIDPKKGKEEVLQRQEIIQLTLPEMGGLVVRLNINYPHAETLFDIKTGGFLTEISAERQVTVDSGKEATTVAAGLAEIMAALEIA